MKPVMSIALDKQLKIKTQRIEIKERGKERKHCVAKIHHISDYEGFQKNFNHPLVCQH